MNYTFYSGFAGMLRTKGAKATAEYAKTMGFSSVEMLVIETSGNVSAINSISDAENVRSVLNEYGLTTACYSVGCTVFRSPETVEALCRHAELAAALGSPFLHHTLKLSVDPASADVPMDEVMEEITAAAIKVANHAKKFGVTCIYEDQGFYANGVKNFGRFFNEVHRVCDNTGVCGDFGNILFVDEKPEDFLKAYASNIKHVHVKDYLGKNFANGIVPEDGWYRTKGGYYLRDTTVGSGIIDIPSCMKILRDIGYNGPYALELCHPEPFDNGVKTAMKYLDAIEKTL